MAAAAGIDNAAMQLTLAPMAKDFLPDHDSIADFRKRHLKALGALFAQGLVLCQASR